MLLLWLCVVAVSANFELHVIHTNDVHARFEEMNKYGGECKKENVATGHCYGGMPRLKTEIEELRQKYPHNVLVDGGDYFQGTIWFHVYKGWAAAHFMNLMKYDAMAVGNHEFDNGPSNTYDFAKNLSFPILSSNMNVQNSSPLDKRLQDVVKKSTVKTIDGHKIGIIGYTTQETVEIAKVGTVKFDDVVESIRKEAQHLKSQGVNMIIAVGHAGYITDQKVAQSVLEVDVVVGGHTDTFLYTGTQPSNEKPVGPYPKVITRTDGTKALVVQDYTFAKYLGHLKVVFDDNGNVLQWGGNPIMLDSTVKRDPAIQKDIDEWKKPLVAFSLDVIARNIVHLDGSKVTCRQKECNLGNVIADALVYENINHADMTSLSQVAVAIVNSGGIRTSLAKGDVTVAKVMSVLPFRNTVDIVTLKGSTIKKMLEHGVKKYEEIPGRFLQFSGIQVWYDMSKPEGQRVQKVLIRCFDCKTSTGETRTPGFWPLSDTEPYRILLQQYMLDGGDGYNMIKPELVDRRKIGSIDMDILAQYIQRLQTVAVVPEGRINISGTSCA